MVNTNAKFTNISIPIFVKNIKLFKLINKKQT